MSDKVTFYTNPMSRGRIIRWMLEETGISYNTEYLTFGGTMKAGDYLALNPMGKVPAIHHRGNIVTECAAICAYLADAFPEAGLAPPNDDRARYYRWMFFTAGPLEASVTNRSLGFVTPPDKARMAGYGMFENVMDTLEGAVSVSPYIAGDRFTAADVYVGAQIGWGLRFGTIENRQSFVEYWSRVSDRDAYRRATEKDDTATQEMQKAG
ncbi:MAG: glutathione S-transferase family protein [Phyllobacterium sp.]